MVARKREIEYACGKDCEKQPGHLRDSATRSGKRREIIGRRGFIGNSGLAELRAVACQVAEIGNIRIGDSPGNPWDLFFIPELDDQLGIIDPFGGPGQQLVEFVQLFRCCLSG